ncbi:Clp protease N-terminal domain-containing protein [Amycolatopsis sp. NPDC048633]|uniref:Clp protease N-terminal domain-containing protein n=1 Tax=Amycolatopsis sp. NPDC048633 TaxID=3157095 RepID=UPI0033C216BE
MIVLRSAVVWGGGIVALLMWNGSANPWLSLVVAAVGLLGTSWWPLTIGVAVTGWFTLDAPILALAVAFLYRLVYADRIRTLWIGLADRLRTRRALSFASRAFGLDLRGPRRSVRHWIARAKATSIQHVPAPPVRCRHGGAGHYREGDQMMRDGRSSDALMSYLEALLSHPAEGICGQVLLARAAEAALEVKAPLVAAELAARAATGISDRPVLRWATLAARTKALQARAAADLGRLEDANQLIRAAQRIPHKNRSTDRFVRMSAVMVFLRSRDALNAEMARDAISGETAQQLSRPSPYELAFLLLFWGDELRRRGDLELASEHYEFGISHAASVASDMVTSGLADPHYRRAVSILLATWCGRLECPGTLGDEDEFPAAADSAVRVGDHLLASRLFLADPRVRGHEGLEEFIRSPLPPWTFADDHLRSGRNQVDAGLSGLVVNPGDRKAAEARAAELFGALAEKHPSIFAAAAARVRGTAGLETPEEPPASAGGVAAQPERELPIVRASRERLRRPVLADVRVPSWIIAAEELVNGPCPVLRRAWEIGRVRGHHLLGVEHLFLAALSDSECREAAVAAGITANAVDEVLRMVTNPDGTPGGLTQSARAVLAGSAIRALHAGVALVRPPHVVLSVLDAAPSALIPLCAGETTDEVAVRLHHGAGRCRSEPRQQLGLGGAFSAPARAALATAVDAAGGTVVSVGALASAVVDAPTAPPSVRARAKGFERRGATAGGGLTSPLWTPRLRHALLTAGAACARWARGVDLMDLLDAMAEAERSPCPARERDAPVPDGQLHRVLTGAAALARADGLDFVGPEHLGRSLRTGAVLEPGTGPWLVFTPMAKQLLARAATVAGRKTLTVGSLRAALDEAEAKQC